jgi:uncharacterized protein YciI
MADTTHYLYRLRPTRPEMLSTGPTPGEAGVVARHFAYLKALAERGVVVLAGRTLTTDERTFGIVILAAESEAAARDLMDEDPAVAHGVMRAELYPFRIAVARR